MKVHIHLPRDLTAGEISVVVITAMREAERQRLLRKREQKRRHDGN